MRPITRSSDGRALCDECSDPIAVDERSVLHEGRTVHEECGRELRRARRLVSA